MIEPGLLLQILVKDCLMFKSKLAQEITKDTYDLGFITLPSDYDEAALEDALEQNITRFLLELGTGFAFIGRQKEIVVSGKTLSAPVRFCNFSPNVECKKMAGKGMQPLNDYTCRFRPSSLKCTDKSGLDGLQADK